MCQAHEINIEKCPRLSFLRSKIEMPKSKIENTQIENSKTWAPPSDTQREGGVLSTLLTEEPWIFRIFDFSIFDFRF